MSGPVKIHVTSPETKVITVSPTTPEVVKVYVRGEQGPKGDPGDPGSGGSSAVTSVNARTGDVVGLAEQSDLEAEVTARQTALDSKADLVSGVIPTSQLPALVTGEIVPVADQAAMLALTVAQVQPGDIAIREDQSGRRWLLADSDPSLLASWIALEVPDAVTTVNGQAGAVVLGSADVGAYPQPTGTATQVVKGNGAIGNIVDNMVANSNKDGLPGVPSMRTLGTGAQQAVAGNDPRLPVKLTQAEYDALAVKDPLTLYGIVG